MLFLHFFRHYESHLDKLRLDRRVILAGILSVESLSFQFHLSPLAQSLFTEHFINKLDVCLFLTFAPLFLGFKSRDAVHFRTIVFIHEVWLSRDRDFAIKSRFSTGHVDRLLVWIDVLTEIK